MTDNDTFLVIVGKLTEHPSTNDWVSADLLATFYDEPTQEHVKHTFMLVGKSLVTTVPATF